MRVNDFKSVDIVKVFFVVGNKGVAISQSRSGNSCIWQLGFSYFPELDSLLNDIVVYI